MDSKNNDTERNIMEQSNEEKNQINSEITAKKATDIAKQNTLSTEREALPEKNNLLKCVEAKDDTSLELILHSTKNMTGIYVIEFEINYRSELISSSNQSDNITLQTILDNLIQGLEMTKADCDSGNKSMELYEQELQNYFKEQVDLSNYLKGILPETNTHFQRILKRIQLAQQELKEAPFKINHFFSKSPMSKTPRIKSPQTSPKKSEYLAEIVDKKKLEMALIKKEEIELAIKFCTDNNLKERLENLKSKLAKMNESIEKLRKGSQFANLKMTDYFLYPIDVTGMEESQREKKAREMIKLIEQKLNFFRNPFSLPNSEFDPTKIPSYVKKMIIEAESQLNKMKKVMNNEWQPIPNFSLIEKRIDIVGFNPLLSPEEFKISFTPDEKLKSRADIELEFQISHLNVVGISSSIVGMNYKEFKYKKDEEFLQKAYECIMQIIIYQQGCCSKEMFKQFEMSFDGLKSMFFVENTFNLESQSSFKFRVELHKPCLKSSAPKSSISKQVIELAQFIPSFKDQPSY